MNLKTVKPITWDIKKIWELLAEIEDKFNVHQWTVEGIHIWPILRIYLATQLSQFIVHQRANRWQQLLKIASVKITRFPLGLGRHIWAICADYKKNDRPQEEVDTIFITHSASRRFFFKEGWFDIFSDPFIDALSQRKISSLVLEYSSGFLYKIPRFNKSRLIQPKLSFLAFLNGLTARRIHISNDMTEELDAFSNFLKSHGLEAYTVDHYYIKLKVGYILKLVDFYRKLFMKHKPSMVFGSCYYSFPEMAANVVCREMGITSVDVQHGIQGEFHPAFGRWNKIPEKGYELLPHIFWNWGQAEAQTIEAWCASVKEYHRPIAGGNMMLHYFSITDSKELKEFDTKIQAINPPDKQKGINILVSLQWNRGFPDLFYQMIKDAPSHYFWWLRLHPVTPPQEKAEIFERASTLPQKNINIQEASDFPLYSLLNHMDVHVTENSSVVLEAEFFGVPSAITDSAGCSYYQKQLDSGIALYANNCVDLLKPSKSRRKRDRKKPGLDPKNRTFLKKTPVLCGKEKKRPPHAIKKIWINENDADVGIKNEHAKIHKTF